MTSARSIRGPYRPHSQPRSSPARSASARLRAAGLGDRRRQVVAHRALRQEQPPGDVGDGRAVRGRRRARRAPGRSAGCGPPARVAAASAGSTTRSPAADPAHRVGELVGRRVLDDEPERARLHRPAQVAGPAERRERRGRGSRAPPRRPRPPRPARRCRASRRRAAARRAAGAAPPASDLVAAGHLADDLEVGLEREQGGERAPDEVLVVGQQQPDAARVTRAPRPAAGSRGGTAGPAVTGPPVAATRSVSPRSPLPRRPPPGPAPSSTTSIARSPSSTAQVPARLCRTALVTPSRTTQPNSSRRSAGTCSTAAGSSAWMPAARSTSRAVASSVTRLTSR